MSPTTIHQAAVLLQFLTLAAIASIGDRIGGVLGIVHSTLSAQNSSPDHYLGDIDWLFSK